MGYTEAEVLHLAGKIRTEEGAYNIMDKHLADAIEILTQRSTSTLSADRTAKDPYRRR
ncbi:MAG: hypothetical protein V9G20_11890 [Candidatus Promineifilaceae bacterium]